MPATGESQTLIVGAGISGLACARALADAGKPPRLLERARGVGGRCATRRIGGQRLDFGVTFLHGRDPAFLAALAAVPATALPGWPVAISGTGRPCQPQAFAPGEQRLALAEGLNAFPRHLAAGLAVTLRAEVTAVEPLPGAVGLVLADGQRLTAPTAVLALAAEQAAGLLATVPGSVREVASAAGVLGLTASQPCLTLLACYPSGTAPPPWHALLPEGSRLVQLVSHESAKRPPGAALALVIQAHAGWSAAHLDDEGWPQLLLEEAGRLLGPWAARPEALEPHRWRHARNDPSAELAGPMLLTLPGGGRLGICGDRFAPGSGVEAAWRSGRALAARLLAQEER